MAQQQLRPLRAGTRQRRAFVGSVAYAAASTLNPQELPRVGLLNRIFVQFRGTVTLSGAGALADQGPWNLIARIQVNANIGAAAIVDLSGYGAYIIQPWVEELGYRPDKGGVGDTAQNADINASPVAMGANTWVLSYFLPIAANTGSQFDTGLINLQAPETRVTVNITCGALLDPATLVTATTGNFFIYYDYYEIPDPRVFALPPLALVRTLEETQAIAAVGDNIYTVPRQGVLLQLAHRVNLNGARSDLWDKHVLRFNKTDSVYNVDRQWERAWERVNYGLNPVTGVLYLDLWHAMQDVSAGDTRDAVDAEELSTLESIVTVNSGATIGTASLGSIRRIVQMLE
jgi:hypothetical protein